MNARRQESTRLTLPNGDELQAYLSHPGSPGEGAVLIIHGFGSRRTGEKAVALEAACERRGWTFAAFDFRAHGASSGIMQELRASRLLEDLDAVRTFLASRGVRRLCPVGSSMGGWAAAWFTLHNADAVPACVAIAPAFYFLQNFWDRRTEAERRHWRQTGTLRVQNAWIDVEVGYGLVKEMDRYSPERLADEWSRPLLIFHGMRDEIIPFSQSVAFAERAAHPDVELRLYKNGDHRLVAFKDAMAEAACVFFTRWLSSDIPARKT